MSWRFSLTTAFQRKSPTGNIFSFLYSFGIYFTKHIWELFFFSQAIGAEDKNWRRGHPREGHNHQKNNCTSSLSSCLWPMELGTEQGSWHCDKHAWAGDGTYPLLLCCLSITNPITQLNTGSNWLLSFLPTLASGLQISPVYPQRAAPVGHLQDHRSLALLQHLLLLCCWLADPLGPHPDFWGSRHWSEGGLRGPTPLCICVCVPGGVINTVVCSEKWIPLHSGFCRLPQSTETITGNLSGVSLSMLQFHGSQPKHFTTQPVWFIVFFFLFLLLSSFLTYFFFFFFPFLFVSFFWETTYLYTPF